jgi:hypothetical protein
MAQIGYVFFQNYFHFKLSSVAVSTASRATFFDYIRTPRVAPRRILHPHPEDCRPTESIRSRLLIETKELIKPNESGNGQSPDAKKLVPRGKGQQGDVPGLLDSASQAALVRSANAGEPPGHDLAALGHKSLQQSDIAVGDRVDLLGTELANLLAAKELSAAAGSTGRPAARSAGRRPAATGAGPA